MATIFETRDERGRVVALTDAAWAHILGRHPEMADRLGDIRRAVEAPDLVTNDAQYAHRENRYRRPGGRILFDRVVVAYRPVPPQGTWIGEIVTAHPIRSVDRKELPR